VDCVYCLGKLRYAESEYNVYTVVNIFVVAMVDFFNDRCWRRIFIIPFEFVG